MLRRCNQNRARLPGVVKNVTQKFNPSLQAPRGSVPMPVENTPIGVKSVAVHNETLSPPPKLVTSMRSPSKAACVGPVNPLPLSVAITVPSNPPPARTTLTVCEPKFGTQMLVPSNAGNAGGGPTSTESKIAPVESSLYSLSVVPGMSSVTQILRPSKMQTRGKINTVVTVAYDVGLGA